MKKPIRLAATFLAFTSGAFGLGWVLKPEPAAKPTANLGGSAGGTRTTLTPDGRASNAKEGLTGAKKASLIADFTTLNGVNSEDMTAAMKAMSKENDPIKKAAMFSALLEQMTPDNAKAAFEALRGAGNNRQGGFGRGGGGDDMRLLLNKWGRIDGKTAVAELTKLAETARAEREAQGEAGGRGRGGRGGGGGFGDGGFDIMSALTGWGTSDSAGAMAYVDSLEGDDRRKGMYTSGIVRGLMVNGVDDAVKFISELPADDGNARSRYMQTVAEEVLEQGSAGAAKWADSLSDPDLKGGAMDRIASSFAREDLEGAVAWVAEHASEDYAKSAVTEVAQRWAETDPQGVIDWAADLPESTQQSVFEEALDEWTERDALAASQYLAQMPESPVKDSAVEGFAKELAREDPESAAVWATTIGSEALRTSTLTDVARNWLRTDRAAAEAWLPTSGLSAEAQQQVVEGGGRGDFSRRFGRGR